MVTRLIWLTLALRLAAPAHAVNVSIDYTYDTLGFFGAGNPDGAAGGAAARAAIEAAADFLSDSVQDTFSAINTPPDFASSVFGGVATWEWSLTFPHPATGSLLTLQDPSIGANEYRVYVGGRPLPGSTIGSGGPGGWGWSTGGNGQGFTSAEINQINAITDVFGDAVASRGEPTGEFGNWGGAVVFDSSPGVNWHYDHTTDPARNENDFFTTAVHELFHVLGFGASDEWSGLVSGGVFTGDASRAANGGSPVPVASTGHWVEGTQSTVFGGSALQETLMDPTAVRGARKLATTLDFASLTDIGWSVVDPPLVGDFNNDGVVDQADYDRWRMAFGGAEGPTANGNGDGLWDAADYTLWRDAQTSATAAVPEPASALGLALLSAALLTRRRR